MAAKKKKKIPKSASANFARKGPLGPKKKKPNARKLS